MCDDYGSARRLRQCATATAVRDRCATGARQVRDRRATGARRVCSTCVCMFDVFYSGFTKTAFHLEFVRKSGLRETKQTPSTACFAAPGFRAVVGTRSKWTRNQTRKAAFCVLDSGGIFFSIENEFLNDDLTRQSRATFRHPRHCRSRRRHHHFR